MLAFFETTIRCFVFNVLDAEFVPLSHELGEERVSVINKDTVSFDQHPSFENVSDIIVPIKQVDQTMLNDDLPLFKCLLFVHKVLDDGSVVMQQNWLHLVAAVTAECQDEENTIQCQSLPCDLGNRRTRT